MPDGLLASPWYWLGHLLYGVALAAAVWRAPWRRIVGEGGKIHVFLGSCVFLLVIWSIKAGISPGLHFHYLGVTTLTLMFGWPLAVIASGLILLGVTLNGGAGWEAFSLNALTMGVVPATVTALLLNRLERELPNNYFVYVLGNGFFGAGLAVAASALAVTLLMLAGGPYDLQRLAYEYLPFFPLMMVPEAFLNGGAMAILVSFRPEWVFTFDDRRYIAGK